MKHIQVAIAVLAMTAATMSVGADSGPETNQPVPVAASTLAGMSNVVVATVPGTNVLWFPSGEKLTYNLYWGIIPVGKAELTAQWVEEKGKKYILLKAAVHTGPILTKIYPVDDRIETLVDPVTFLPVRYVQRLKEGRHLRYDVIEFRHKARVADWTSGFTQEKKTITIGPDTRDVLSLVYYMRSKPANVGDKRSFKVLVDDKLYNLQLAALAEDKMSVIDGEMKCLRVEPKASFGAIFVRKGKVMSWFSRDERCICVRMAAKVPVANVKAVLSRVEGWGEGEWPPPAKKK